MEIEDNKMTDLAEDTRYEIAFAIRCSRSRKEAEERILAAYENSSYRLLMYKTMAAGLIRYIEEYLGEEINESKLDDYIDHEISLELNEAPCTERSQRKTRNNTNLRLIDDKE